MLAPTDADISDFQAYEEAFVPERVGPFCCMMAN